MPCSGAARLLFPALAIPLAAAGCASAPDVPAPVAAACPPGDWGHDYLDIRPAIARQGETLALAPRRDMSPAGSEPVPLACTSGWSVSDPALATLSRDRASLRIAPDAPPGAEFKIAYTVRARRVEAQLRIVGRDAIVLVGARRQTGAEGCGDVANVGEIAFSLDRFSVTFRPFESYKDYWGTYRFDAATGALVLTAEGGNNIPPNLDLEGIARLTAGGQLVLEGFYLGDPRGATPVAPGCRYTFG